MITGILLIQAAAFAVLSGIVANNKNRDPAGWSVIGLLFGLFGFIAVIAVNAVKNEKKCPACAEHIKVEARVCKHCGYEFSDEEVEQRIAESSEDSNREKSFSYKELDAYSHVSNIFSFIISITISIFGGFALYGIFSNPDPFNLILYVELTLSTTIFLASISFAYSTLKVYNNSDISIYSITLPSTFILSFFLLIGIRRIYRTYDSTHFGFGETLIYLLLVAMSTSVYYSYKSYFKLVEDNNAKIENTKNIFEKKVFSLSIFIRSFRVNKVILYTIISLYFVTPIVGYMTS